MLIKDTYRMDIVKKHNEVITSDQRSAISSRYKRITKAINREFWNSESETAHSFYVGSYGRGTAVNTSDIDILIELPYIEFSRFDNYTYNGQSKLLQVVKDAIITTYPRSIVKADGQIVKIDFSDGITFEILPSFKERNIWGEETGKYIYADSNHGGKWRSTNPKVEQEAMKRKNIETNGLLFDTCKHIRQIRDTKFSSYQLSGIVIDSYVFNHIDNWQWCPEGVTSTKPKGTFEKKLRDEISYSDTSLYAPGSYDIVDSKNSIECLQKVLNHMAKDF